MNYAIILDGHVDNIIVGPLPNGMSGVSLGDRPVAIGDAYENGVFMRNGEPVLTNAERIAALEAQLLALQQEP
jgi:hypothetical protein